MILEKNLTERVILLLLIVTLSLLVLLKLSSYDLLTNSEISTSANFIKV